MILLLSNPSGGMRATATPAAVLFARHRAVAAASKISSSSSSAFMYPSQNRQRQSTALLPRRHKSSSSSIWSTTGSSPSGATSGDRAAGGRLSSLSSAAFSSSETTNSSSNNNKADSAYQQQQVVQDMLYRIRQVNNLDTTGIRQQLLEFCVDGVVLGIVHPDNAEVLSQVSVIAVGCDDNNNNNNKHHNVFELVQGDEKPFLTLTSAASCYGKDEDDDGTIDIAASRTAAVGAVMEQLRQNGFVKGWRNELYPVSYSFYEPAVFMVERAAASLLGVLEYGVHMNGLVGENDPRTSRPQMWMARRSATKSKFPGFLDHIAAGGQPAGMNLIDNVIKECWEEAGIPQSLTRDRLGCVVPAGAISYESYSETTKTVSRCVLFAYDLYLPSDFKPQPVDDEVEEFFLWNMDQVQRSLATNFADPMKPNCYLIVIDYLLRQGIVTPDTPGYLNVLRELRSGDCR